MGQWSSDLEMLLDVDIVYEKLVTVVVKKGSSVLASTDLTLFIRFQPFTTLCLT